MAAGAANMMFRCVFDASLSMCDMDIERRPYHRNCKCALHKQKGNCLNIGRQQRNVLFPKREFKDKCCSVSVSASTVSSRSSYVRSLSSTSVEFSCSRVQCGKVSK